MAVPESGGSSGSISLLSSIFNLLSSYISYVTAIKQSEQQNSNASQGVQKCGGTAIRSASGSQVGCQKTIALNAVKTIAKPVDKSKLPKVKATKIHRN